MKFQMNEKTGSYSRNGIYRNQWNPWPFTFFGGAYKFVCWIVGLKLKTWKESILCISEDCSALKVYHPYFKRSDYESSSFKDSNLKMTWLGHASVLIEMDDFKILCDPVFSERAPNYVGPKRFKASPCQVADLPEIDAVLISHNHYDHMDITTLEQIGKRFTGINWCVPKGDKEKIESFANKLGIKEMDWWEEIELNKAGKTMKIVFTPTQHWSNRGILDRFKSLWGSWAFIGSHKVWFGGDTGYCDAFKEIGDNLGPFDLAAIPIGAYEPRDMMKYQHVNPTEAVKIHQDIRAKQSVGIHWGTFVLTNEDKMAPKQDLANAVDVANQNSSEDSKVHFITLHHGETIKMMENGFRYETCNGGEKIEPAPKNCTIL